MGSRWILWTAVFVLVAGGLSACGADRVRAPRPRSVAQASCGSAKELMPLFLHATRTGQTEGLRYLMERYFSATSEDRPVPAMNLVMGALFRTVAAFAAQPPETGAPEGEKCAVIAPPVESAHPLCELRRSMDSLVHEGAGLEALKLADPLIAAVLNYIIGRLPSSAAPHYADLSPVIVGLFEQSAVCHMNHALDLAMGITAYANTPEGRAGLDRLDALVNHPALEPYIVNDQNQYGGERGIVALSGLLTRIVVSMDDPSDLNEIPVAAFPTALRPQLELAISDMKSMLSLDRSPNLLRPMQKVLTCISYKDPSSELVRMAYRLGLEQDLPEFGLRNLIGVVRGLRDADSRGSLLRLGQIFAQAVRDDAEAGDAAAWMVRTMFSLHVEPGHDRSAAELALPIMADLFQQGMLAEGVCAADTLLYGCAGGERPACVSKP